MERKVTKYLLEWKNSPYRKPMILQGARQVGKTYILLLTIWMISKAAWRRTSSAISLLLANTAATTRPEITATR